jgi:hypothetical protein
MMVDNDKKSFKQLLDTMQDCFELEHFDKAKLLEWWNELNTLTLDELQTKVDVFIEMNDKPPMLSDLVSNKPMVTIRSRNITPLTIENNRARAKELVEFVSKLNAK